MFEFRTNMSSWFWRIWISGMAALLAFFFFKADLQSSLVLWLILSIANFIALSDSGMEKIMDLLFNKKTRICIMCVITAGVVSMAITFLFILLAFQATSDLSITIIKYSSFFSYLGLIFLVKYFKMDYTKLCIKVQNS
jgi:hypothetical protein